MDTQTLWQIVLADLEVQVGKVMFQTFLSQTKLLELSDQTATIGCTQPFLLSLIEKRYYPLIKKTLDSYTKLDTTLLFKPISGPPKTTIDGPLFHVKPQQNMSTSRVRLHPEYTFENFAVSSSNQMAYAAATAVSQKPAVSYNPLFLYGGVGVGKTHLMQAIAHIMIKNRSQTKLTYCTGEEFTNEIIEAIGNKSTVSFKKKYRNLNLLLIDDIQFIAGKNAVQEEFFHTFNAIQQSGGQIILTSDKPPEEIPRLEARLQSRFEGGLSIDIGPPDFELRTAILLIKAKQRDVALPINLAKLIATSVENPRKLEGVLVRALTESQTQGVPLDEDLIRSILGKTAKKVEKTAVSPQKALQVVASYYHLTLTQLKGAKRDRAVSLPRQVLYYILRSELNVPLVDIGNIVGGRDHTTILYGVRKISDLLQVNKTINGDILGIKQQLLE
ncbi:chromosomal replication initiator protein DnaA [Candidatus Gottesmanbacteria bacterium]|nr:chromosomal replication initiator protein DnaA [Candidatus Gottesmanbacteria bacterium]